MTILSKPVSFFWEISHHCNLQCIHCYTNSGKEHSINVDLSHAKNVIDQAERDGIVGYAIGGGEPLLLPYLSELIEYSVSKKIGVTVTTNGTLLTEDNVKRLADAGLTLVQVSIDGDQEIHDALRGEGTYVKALKGAELLMRHGIMIRIATTLNKLNMHTIKHVIANTRKLGVKTQLFFRYMPTSKMVDKLDLTCDDLLTITKILLEEEQNSNRTPGSEKFSLGFAPLNFFSFLLYPKHLFMLGCTAGCGKYNILPDGTVTPCSHVHKGVGNIYTQDSTYVWQKVVEAREELMIIPDECKECEHAEVCRGGCKGFSFIKYGNFSNKDYGCFKHLLGVMK